MFLTFINFRKDEFKSKDDDLVENIFPSVTLSNGKSLGQEYSLKTDFGAVDIKLLILVPTSHFHHRFLQC